MVHYYLSMVGPKVSHYFPVILPYVVSIMHHENPTSATSNMYRHIIKRKENQLAGVSDDVITILKMTSSVLNAT